MDKENTLQLCLVNILDAFIYIYTRHGISYSTTDTNNLVLSTIDTTNPVSSTPITQTGTITSLNSQSHNDQQQFQLVFSQQFLKPDASFPIAFSLSL